MKNPGSVTITLKPKWVGRVGTLGTKLGTTDKTSKRSTAAYVACINWAASSKFVFSSIPSWQILTAHAQPCRGARDLAFCLKVPLDSLLVWASSGGSGETARMRRLAWTFAARIGDNYQIRLTRPNLNSLSLSYKTYLFNSNAHGSKKYPFSSFLFKQRYQKHRYQIDNKRSVIGLPGAIII